MPDIKKLTDTGTGDAQAAFKAGNQAAVTTNIATNVDFDAMDQADSWSPHAEVVKTDEGSGLKVVDNYASDSSNNDWSDNDTSSNWYDNSDYNSDITTDANPIDEKYGDADYDGSAENYNDSATGKKEEETTDQPIPTVETNAPESEEEQSTGNGEEDASAMGGKNAMAGPMEGGRKNADFVPDGTGVYVGLDIEGMNADRNAAGWNYNYEGYYVDADNNKVTKQVDEYGNETFVDEEGKPVEGNVYIVSGLGQWFNDDAKAFNYGIGKINSGEWMTEEEVQQHQQLFANLAYDYGTMADWVKGRLGECREELKYTDWSKYSEEEATAKKDSLVAQIMNYKGIYSDITTLQEGCKESYDLLVKRNELYGQYDDDKITTNVEDEVFKAIQSVSDAYDYFPEEYLKEFASYTDEEWDALLNYMDANEPAKATSVSYNGIGGGTGFRTGSFKSGFTIGEGENALKFDDHNQWIGVKLELQKMRDAALATQDAVEQANAFVLLGRKYVGTEDKLDTWENIRKGLDVATLPADATPEQVKELEMEKAYADAKIHDIKQGAYYAQYKEASDEDIEKRIYELTYGTPEVKEAVETTNPAVAKLESELEKAKANYDAAVEAGKSTLAQSYASQVKSLEAQIAAEQAQSKGGAFGGRVTELAQDAIDVIKGGADKREDLTEDEKLELEALNRIQWGRAYQEMQAHKEELERLYPDGEHINAWVAEAQKKVDEEQAKIDALEQRYNEGHSFGLDRRDFESADDYNSARLDYIEKAEESLKAAEKELADAEAYRLYNLQKQENYNEMVAAGKAMVPNADALATAFNEAANRVKTVGLYGEYMADPYEPLKAVGITGENADEILELLKNPNESSIMALLPNYTKDESLSTQLAKAFLPDMGKLTVDGFTQDELNNYYYLLASEGFDSASKFALQINNENNAEYNNALFQRYMEYKDFNADYYGKAGVWASALVDPFAETVMGWTGTSEILKDAIDIAYFGSAVMDALPTIAQYAEWMQKGDAYELAKLYPEVEHMQDFYGVYSSIINSTVTMLTGQGIAQALGGMFGLSDIVMGGKDFVERFAGAFTDYAFFGSSASSRFRELKEQGVDDDIALYDSVMTGAFEVFFEHFSFEEFYHAKDVMSWHEAGFKRFMDWTVNTAKSAAIEGSEELFTNWGNRLGDSIFDGKGGFTSEFSKAENLRKEQLKGSGLSQEEIDKEAFKYALSEAIHEDAKSFVAGTASGGISVGARSAYNSYIDSHDLARWRTDAGKAYNDTKLADGKTGAQAFGEYFKDYQFIKPGQEGKYTEAQLDIVDGIKELSKKAAEGKASNEEVGRLEYLIEQFDPSIMTDFAWGNKEWFAQIRPGEVFNGYVNNMAPILGGRDKVAKYMAAVTANSAAGITNEVYHDFMAGLKQTDPNLTTDQLNQISMALGGVLAGSDLHAGKDSDALNANTQAIIDFVTGSDGLSDEGKMFIWNYLKDKVDQNIPVVPVTQVKGGPSQDWENSNVNNGKFTIPPASEAKGTTTTEEAKEPAKIPPADQAKGETKEESQTEEEKPIPPAYVTFMQTIGMDPNVTTKNVGDALKNLIVGAWDKMREARRTTVEYNQALEKQNEGLAKLRADETNAAVAAALAEPDPDNAGTKIARYRDANDSLTIGDKSMTRAEFVAEYTKGTNGYTGLTVKGSTSASAANREFDRMLLAAVKNDGMTVEGVTASMTKFDLSTREPFKNGETKSEAKAEGEKTSEPAKEAEKPAEPKPGSGETKAEAQKPEGSNGAEKLVFSGNGYSIVRTGDGYSVRKSSGETVGTSTSFKAAVEAMEKDKASKKTPIKSAEEKQMRQQEKKAAEGKVSEDTKKAEEAKKATPTPTAEEKQMRQEEKKAAEGKVSEDTKKAEEKKAAALEKAQADLEKAEEEYSKATDEHKENLDTVGKDRNELEDLLKLQADLSTPDGAALDILGYVRANGKEVHTVFGQGTAYAIDLPNQVEVVVEYSRGSVGEKNPIVYMFTGDGKVTLVTGGKKGTRSFDSTAAMVAENKTWASPTKIIKALGDLKGDRVGSTLDLISQAHNNRMEDIDARIAELQGKVKDGEAAVKDSQAKLDTAGNDLNEAKKSAEVLSAEETDPAEAAQKEVADSKTAVADAHEKAEAAKTELEDFKKQYDTDSAERQKKIDQAIADEADKKKAASDAAAEEKTAKSEYKEASDAAKSKSKDGEERLRTAKIQGDYAQAARDLAEAQNKEKAARIEYERAKAAKDSAKNSKAKSIAQSAFSKAKKLFEAARKSLATAQEAFNESKTELDALQAEQKKTQDALAALDQKKNDAHQKTEDAKKALADARQVTSDLKKEQKTEQSKLKELERQAREANKAEKAAEDRLKQAEKAADKYKADGEKRTKQEQEKKEPVIPTKEQFDEKQSEKEQAPAPVEEATPVAEQQTVPEEATTKEPTVQETPATEDFKTEENLTATESGGDVNWRDWEDAVPNPDNGESITRAEYVERATNGFDGLDGISQITPLSFAEANDEFDDLLDYFKNGSNSQEDYGDDDSDMPPLPPQYSTGGTTQANEQAPKMAYTPQSVQSAVDIRAGGFVGLNPVIGVNERNWNDTIPSTNGTPISRAEYVAYAMSGKDAYSGKSIPPMSGAEANAHFDRLATIMVQDGGSIEFGPSGSIVTDMAITAELANAPAAVRAIAAELAELETEVARHITDPRKFLEARRNLNQARRQLQNVLGREIVDAAQAVTDRRNELRNQLQSVQSEIDTLHNAISGTAIHAMGYEGRMRDLRDQKQKILTQIYNLNAADTRYQAAARRAGNYRNEMYAADYYAYVGGVYGKAESTNRNTGGNAHVGNTGGAGSSSGSVGGSAGSVSSAARASAGGSVKSAEQVLSESGAHLKGKVIFDSAGMTPQDIANNKELTSGMRYYILAALRNGLGRVIITQGQLTNGRLVTDKNGKTKEQPIYAQRYTIKDGDREVSSVILNMQGHAEANMIHEIAHHMLAKMPEAKKRALLTNIIENAFGGRDDLYRVVFNSYLPDYGIAYGAQFDESGKPPESLVYAVYEEMVADFYAGIHRYVGNPEVANAMAPFWDEVSFNTRLLFEAFGLEDYSKNKWLQQEYKPDETYNPESFTRTDTAFGQEFRQGQARAPAQEDLPERGKIRFNPEKNAYEVRFSLDGEYETQEGTQPEIYNITGDPELNGQYSVVTEYDPFAKQTIIINNKSVKKTTNKDSSGNIIPATVRELRDEAFHKNKDFMAQYGEEGIQKVNDFFDKVAQYLREAEEKFEYLDFADINNATLKLDPVSNTLMLTSMVKNGEYEVNVDFGTICERRQALQSIVNELLRDAKYDDNGVGSVVLNAETLHKINTALRDAGINTQCLICFVETKRYNQQKQFGEFTNMWNTAVRARAKELGITPEHFNFQGDYKLTPEHIRKRREALKGYKQGGSTKDAVERLVGLLPAEDLKLLSVSDIISSKGRTNIAQQFPTLNSLILKKGGSAAPKPVYAFIPYNGEIESLNSPAGTKRKPISEDKRAEILQNYIKSIAGVRSQSFSDFIITHVFDHLQKTGALAAKNLAAHTYTKVLSRALLFGLTGEKINMSILFDIDPSVNQWYAGLNSETQDIYVDIENPRNRPYMFSDWRAREEGAAEWVQSFPWDDGVKTQNTEGYSKNTGMIGVALSYWHYKWLLADPEIRQVIGYHSSSYPAAIKNATKLFLATDYTPVQNVLSFNGFAKPNYEIPAGTPSYASAPQTVKLPKNTARTTAVSDNSFADIKAEFAKRVADPLNEGKTKAEIAHEFMQEMLDYADKNGLVFQTDLAEHGHGDFDLYGDVEKTQNPYETADDFLVYCFEKGYLPMFYEFATDPNYYKQLFDFNMFDRLSYNPETGLHEDTEDRKAYAPQEAVRMFDDEGNLAFPKDFIDILDKAAAQYNKEQGKVQGVINNDEFMDQMRGITENQNAPQFSLYDGIEDAAEEHFGTTENYTVAGYLLRDGKMLDFSGNHYGGGYGRNDLRIVDHNDVSEAFDLITNRTPSDAAGAFISRGNIRLSPEAPGVNLTAKVEPTPEQYNTLRDFIADRNTEDFYLDIMNSWTNHPVKTTYAQGVNPDKVINDIKAFYRDGTIPQQSTVNQFHGQFSLSGVDVYDNRVEEQYTNSNNEQVTVGQFSLGITSITYFAGSGTLDYALKDRVFHLLAVEYDPEIRDMFIKNNGNSVMVTDADVNEVRPGTVLAGHVDYFHASPVCKNFSMANNKSGETDLDRSFARSIVKGIEAWKPKVFTLENVKGYLGSDSLKIVTDTLDKLGYKWDVDVYRASDYGAATIRDRLFVRAVLDGELPPAPVKTGSRSWWDAVEDIIDELPIVTGEKAFSASRQERLDRMAEEARRKGKGLDIYNLTQPVLLLSGTKGREIQYAFADSPAPTLMTKGDEARIVMPDGTVRKVTPHVYARIQGLDDNFILPTQKRNPDQIHQTNAFKILGNGVPTQLTQAIVNPLLNTIEAKNRQKIDDQYLGAIERGDLDTARALFNHYVLEKNTDAVTPFLYTSKYSENYGHNSAVAHGIKLKNDKYLNIAADEMVSQVPDNAVLIPMPGRHGYADDTLELAQAIADRYNATHIDQIEVMDILKGNDRPSQYETKRATGKSLNLDTFGMYLDGQIPEGKFPVLIDNVVASGTTATAAQKAVGGGMTLAFAYGDRSKPVAGLKFAEPITYDDNGNPIPLSERFNPDNPDMRYSLAPVDPVQPSSNEWSRTIDSAEAKEQFPNLWDVTADESEVRNPTQIQGTVKTYRKIYDILKEEGFDGTILDASSGLGYGTRAGIDEYGFDVEDIEPYPDKSYNPKYTDYSTLDKQYDVIISNAVLNVLPQDLRDALTVKMGQLLKPGGRMFINVRSANDVKQLAKNANNAAIGNGDYYVASSGSYQKGFTKNELKAYIQDALGDGYTVDITNKFGDAAVIVTKNKNTNGFGTTEKANGQIGIDFDSAETPTARFSLNVGDVVNIEDVAKEIANLDTERYYILTPDGEVLYKQEEGTHGSVSVSVGTKRDYLSGNISIHNHPEGGTFSTPDLRDFGYGARQIIAISPGGIFTLSNDKFGTREQFDGWLDMQNAIIEEVPQEIHPYDLTNAAKENTKNTPEAIRMREITQEWVRRKDAGASNEELTEFMNASGYNALAEKQKETLRAERRYLEVEPSNKWFKENAKKYGFTYSFEPNSPTARFSLAIDESNTFDQFGDEIQLDDYNPSVTQSDLSGNLYYSYDGNTAYYQTDTGETVVLNNVGPDSPEARYINYLEANNNANNTDTTTAKTYTIPPATRNEYDGYNLREQDAGLRRGAEEVPTQNQEGTLRRAGNSGERYEQGESQSSQPQGVSYALLLPDNSYTPFRNKNGDVITTAEAYPYGSMERIMIQAWDTGDFTAMQDQLDELFGDKENRDQILDIAEQINQQHPELTDQQREATQKLIEELRKQWGTMPSRKNPKRDVHLPKSIDGQTKIMKGAQTHAQEAETEWLSEETMYEALNNELLSYTPTSNADALKEAERYIKTHNGNYDALVQEVHGWLESKERIKPWQVAVGELLLKELETEGRAQQAMALVIDLTLIAHETGQALQAFNILRKATPRGQLYYLQGVVNQLNKQYADQISSGKMPKVELPKWAAQRMLACQTRQELDTVVEDIKNEIAKRLPISWGDRWNAWRYLSMLGNPRTHVRNMLGNAMFSPAVFIKDIVARGIENSMYNSGKLGSKVKAKGVDLSSDSEWMKFAMKDFDVMQKILVGEANGNKYADANDILSRRDIWGKEKWLGGRFLAWVDELNSMGLTKEDEVFLKMYYTRAFAEFLQARGVTEEAIKNKEFGAKPEDRKLIGEARAWATLEAQRNTYRDANAFAQWVNSMKRKNKAAYVLLEGLMPFTKTPMNILQRGIEYSPIGLVKSIIQLRRDLASPTKMTTSQAIDRFSAGLTGTAIMALGLLLSKLGILRGSGGFDKKKKELEELQGHQAWSVELFGKSYTIDWMAPAALPLFIGSAIYDMLTRDKDEEFSFEDMILAFAGIANPLSQLSMLDGINTMLTNISNAEGTEQYAILAWSMLTSYAGQGVPTLFGQVARTFDPDRRSTHIQPGSANPMLQRFIQSSLQGKIPIWENKKMPYVDNWGRKDTNNNILTRALENFLSPGYFNNIIQTDVDAEIERLYGATKDGDLVPSKLQKHFQVEGEKKNLTAEEYEKYVTDRGQTAYGLLNDLFSSPYYSSLNDAEKALKVKEVLDLSEELSKQDVDPNYVIKEDWMNMAKEVGLLDYMLIKDDLQLNRTHEQLFAYLSMNPDLNRDQIIAIVANEYAAPDKVASQMYDTFNYNITQEDNRYMQGIFAEELRKGFERLDADEDFQKADPYEQGRRMNTMYQEAQAETKRRYGEILDAEGRVKEVGSSTGLGNDVFEKALTLTAAEFNASYGEGNIDLNSRNTENIVVNLDGKFVVIPSEGMTEEEAVKRYRETGENFGVFDTQARATSYSKKIVHDQAERIAKGWTPAADDIEAQSRWIGQSISGDKTIENPNRAGWNIVLDKDQKYERDERFRDAWDGRCREVMESKAFNDLPTKELQGTMLNMAADALMNEINAQYATELYESGKATEEIGKPKNSSNEVLRQTFTIADESFDSIEEQAIWLAQLFHGESSVVVPDKPGYKVKLDETQKAQLAGNEQSTWISTYMQSFENGNWTGKTQADKNAYRHSLLEDVQYQEGKKYYQYLIDNNIDYNIEVDVANATNVNFWTAIFDGSHSTEDIYDMIDERYLANVGTSTQNYKLDRTQRLHRATAYGEYLQENKVVEKIMDMPVEKRASAFEPIHEYAMKYGLNQVKQEFGITRTTAEADAKRRDQAGWSTNPYLNTPLDYNKPYTLPNTSAPVSYGGIPKANNPTTTTTTQTAPQQFIIPLANTSDDMTRFRRYF